MIKPRPGRCAAPVHALGLPGDGSLMAKLRVCMTDREVKAGKGRGKAEQGCKERENEKEAHNLNSA